MDEWPIEICYLVAAYWEGLIRTRQGRRKSIQYWLRKLHAEMTARKLRE